MPYLERIYSSVILSLQGSLLPLLKVGVLLTSVDILGLSRGIHDGYRYYHSARCCLLVDTSCKYTRQTCHPGLLYSRSNERAIDLGMAVQTVKLPLQDLQLVVVSLLPEKTMCFGENNATHAAYLFNAQLGAHWDIASQCLKRHGSPFKPDERYRTLSLFLFQALS